MRTSERWELVTQVIAILGGLWAWVAHRDPYALGALCWLTLESFTHAKLSR